MPERPLMAGTQTLSISRTTSIGPGEFTMPPVDGPTRTARRGGPIVALPISCYHNWRVLLAVY